MGTSTQYGNDNYWCFIDSSELIGTVAIWSGKEGSEEIIAYATSKYDARLIVDALLLKFNSSDNKQVLGKKELVFLDFVKANVVEPYATMAANAILWNDLEAYKTLKKQFDAIY